MPSKAYIRDYFRRKRQGGPWGRARFKKAKRGGRFKSKYGRKRKRVSVPKRRMRKKALVRSRFHYAPKDKEVPLTFVNDEPLILRKPAIMLDKHAVNNEFDNDSKFLSGAAEPNFRFSCSLQAVKNQIKGYLQLYKEFKITGVTIKFTPTWTKGTVTKALKQRVMTQKVANEPAQYDPDGNVSHPPVDHSNKTITSDVPGRIPNGWFPRLYYRVPKFGQITDLRTMMPNQTIAREMGASSKSFLGPLTFRYVPKLYRTIFDASGMPITKAAGTTGWMPCDNAFDREFGGLDFCISPYPNFDWLSNESQTNSASAITGNGKANQIAAQVDDDGLHQRLFGIKEYNNRERVRFKNKLYADDRNSINDQYVTVTRTYHVLFRGRVTKYYNDEAWANGEYGLKPTPMAKIGFYHNKDRFWVKTGTTPQGETHTVDGVVRPKSVTPAYEWKTFPEFRDICMAGDTGMSRQDARHMMKDATNIMKSKNVLAMAALSYTRNDNQVNSSKVPSQHTDTLEQQNAKNYIFGTKQQAQDPMVDNPHTNPAMGDQDASRTTYADTFGETAIAADAPMRMDATEDAEPLPPKQENIPIHDET